MKKVLKSAIYGFATGDAVGVPYEFKKRRSFQCVNMTGYGTYNLPAGTWSDDTAMVLATCDSLRECGEIDCEDLMDRFYAWIAYGEYTADGVAFDIGRTTQAAIAKYAQGISFNECGGTDFHDNGNGALMRMLPLAFTDASPGEIRKVAQLTHAHKISTDICVKYVQLTRDLIRTRDIKQTFGRDYDDLFKLPDVYVQSTGFVIDTFDAAKWALINSKSYKDCILKAVNLGDDTDTIAAIAGGWAGIIYGYKNIPLSWRLRLKNKKLINSCINREELR